MKTTISISVIFVVLLGLSACSSTTTGQSANGVVASGASELSVADIKAMRKVLRNHYHMADYADDLSQLIAGLVTRVNNYSTEADNGQDSFDSDFLPAVANMHADQYALQLEQGINQQQAQQLMAYISKHYQSLAREFDVQIVRAQPVQFAIQFANLQDEFQASRLCRVFEQHGITCRVI